MVKTIIDNAKDLQSCYLDFLKNEKTVKEGVVNFLIKVEEDGQISSVKITKNELENEKMSECLVDKISSFYLAPPPYGINRFISHTLAFKSEETAKKEAEQRAKDQGPPKVLPVR